VASAVAGFAGLLQLMFVAFVEQHTFWVPVFAFLSLATMTIGNLVALQQKHAVRLLAYSGIAQSGYILLPFALVTSDAASNRLAFSASVAYILIYGVMNLGAFAVVTAVSRRAPNLLITDFAGLARVVPLLAVGMTIFMISLAGVPPTGGIWAKLLIFRAAIERGEVLGPLLAAAMVINSVISIAYYFMIPREMIFREPGDGLVALRSPALVSGVVVIAMVVVIAIFFLPNPFADLADLSTLAGGAGS
jgi:NADH-quinone oxidoreductase subunit N